MCSPRDVDLTMALNGALAGLVSITADPLSTFAMIVGHIGSVLVIVLDRGQAQDRRSRAISVHGTVGIWGVLKVNATIGGQLLDCGDLHVDLCRQFALKAIMGIRISEEEERRTWPNLPGEGHGRRQECSQVRSSPR